MLRYLQTVREKVFNNHYARTHSTTILIHTFKALKRTKKRAMKNKLQKKEK